MEEEKRKKRTVPSNDECPIGQGKAGLVYVSDFDDGIRRRKCGRGFTFVSNRGMAIQSPRTLRRIKSLVIPPAWTDVWICSNARGHIQAIGRDATGRRQYVYHHQWQVISASKKYDRMRVMAAVLPRIRRRLRRDLSRKRLTKRRVLAAIVRLIDKTNIRVGSVHYTEAHGSRGATTLTTAHVNRSGFTVALDFPGKSGQRVATEVTDARVARVVRRCEEIDGQFLFCYQSEAGEYKPIHSTDVNEYLREVARERITAKDFRTWWGSVVALSILCKCDPLTLSKRERKRQIAEAVAETAAQLGNTRAVSRQSYIHPAILASFQSGELPKMLERSSARNHRRYNELTVDEARLARLLPIWR